MFRTTAYLAGGAAALGLGYYLLRARDGAGSVLDQVGDDLVLLTTSEESRLADLEAGTQAAARALIQALHEDGLEVHVGQTLRTTARYADLWNGYGSPERIGVSSDVLRERCAEIGRPFDAIERTVTVHAVVRDTVDDAEAAWAEVARTNGLTGVAASDGSDRGLTVGGDPETIARYLVDYARIGVSEVILVFRSPVDLETIERIGEVRAALAPLATSA
jgi:hypothetical protein